MPRNKYLSQALSHHMYVMNIQEDELCVSVGILVLVASALGHIGHSIDLWSRIVDVYSVRLRVGVQDEGNHLLVLLAPLAGHAGQRLGTPRDCGQAENNLDSGLMNRIPGHIKTFYLFKHKLP